MTTDNALWVRFAQLQSSTVGDVLDELGYRDQVLDSALRPIALSMSVAGPAFTIQGIARPEHISDTKPKPGYEMFRHMYDGCVAVMDTGGHSIAGPWGASNGATTASCAAARSSWRAASRKGAPRGLRRGSWGSARTRS